MCGRYMIVNHQEISERFQLRQIPLGLFSTFNAAPTQGLPVVIEVADGERELRLMRWGLIPCWRKGAGKAPAPINARAETLLEKPMFRSLVGSKRCVVPANGFYEWRKEGGRKQPYLVRCKDGDLFGFAGLYDELPDGEGGSFTIITTTPNELVAPLHDRMPAILAPEDEEEWLDRDISDPGIVGLLGSYPAEQMAAEPVSTSVNDVRNDGRELVSAKIRR